MKSWLKVTILLVLTLLLVSAVDAAVLDSAIYRDVVEYIGYITSYDIWWPASPSPDFVINETNEFNDGTLNQVYPSGDALRLGTINELFTEDTDYPSSTLSTANWTSTDASDYYWTSTNGGSIYFSAERQLNTYDQYTIPVTPLVTNEDDFSFSFDYKITSQSHVIFFKIGLFNSSRDYTVDRWSQVKFIIYSGITPVDERIYGIRYFNDTGGYSDHGSYYIYNPNTWYHVYCYNDEDGSSAGNYPLFNCTLFDSTGTTTIYSWEINSVFDNQVTVDDLGLGDLDADTKAGAIVGHIDNFVFNNISTHEYPQTGDWTSDTITMAADKKLENMTINLTADSNNYLTKVEWLRDSDNAVLASNETNIVASGTVTYSTVNGLDSGSFDDLDQDFKLRLYLVGDGTDTPVIDDVIGYYEDVTEPHCYYSNGTTTRITSGLVIESDEDVTCNDTSVDLAGDIEIYGNLSLENFTILFDMQSDGEYNITSYAGSIFNISEQTNITSSNTDYEYVIHVYGNFTMRDSYLSECGWVSGSRGLTIYSDNANIINNTIHDVYSGVQLSGSDYSLIEDVTVYRATNHIYIQESAFNTVRDSEVYYGGGPGIIVIGSNCHNNTLEHVTSHSLASGIYVYSNAYNNTVDFLTSYNHTSYGYFSGFTSNDNTLKNSYIHDVGHGIYNLIGVTNHKYENITIENASTYGIYSNGGGGNEYTDVSLDGGSATDIYLMSTTIPNTFYDLVMNDTTVSFIATDIIANDLQNPEPTPPNLVSLDAYITITNNDADAWVELNVSYDTDLAVNEENIDIYKNDSTGWVAQSGTVNTADNYVSKNLTSFSPFGLFESGVQCYYSDNTGVIIDDGVTVEESEDLTCNDTSVSVDGDIIVYGNLTLDNFDLTLVNEKADRESNINIYLSVKDNKFIVDNQSYIRSSNNDYEYNFSVESAEVHIKNSYISETYDGLFIYADNAEIINNTISNSTGYGVDLVESDNSLVEDNIFTGNKDGIGIIGSEFTNIVNNTIANENGYGIYLHLIDAPNKNITIENNTITFAGTTENDALHAVGAKNTTIKGNDISFNKNGVFLDDYTQLTRIIDNEIFNNTEYGIQVYCVNEHYYINGNILYYNNDGIGIVSDGSRTCPANLDINITNNNITYNTDTGINASYASIIATDNNVSLNTYGLKGLNIYFHNTYINNISYNNILQNTYGIYLDTAGAFDARDMHIDGNTIEDSDYGFYIKTISRGIHINDNNITNSALNDVYNLNANGSIYTNLNINGTNMSFYGNSYTVNEVYDTDIPADDIGIDSISTYLNITDNGAGSWVYMNLTYDDDLASNEDKIRLFRYNGTDWLYSDSSVDTTHNYIYGNITSFSIFGGFEDNWLYVEAINILPDEGDPGTLINPIEDSNKTVNVTVNFTNKTTIDMCLVTIFNSTENYTDPVFSVAEGTIQNCNGHCDCFYEWNMSYWRNSGDWNVSVDLNSTAGVSNFTSANFTYNELTAIDVNTSTITYTGIPGQTVQADDAYPLQVKNTGNQLFNVSLNGTDYPGLTYPELIINVENSTYNETTDGTFKSLTYTYERIFTQIVPAVAEFLYFKGIMPVGFKAQTYQGYIEFKIN